MCLRMLWFVAVLVAVLDDAVLETVHVLDAVQKQTWRNLPMQPWKDGNRKNLGC